MSFTLLTLPNVGLSSSNVSEHGTLSLECGPSVNGVTVPGTGIDSSVALAFRLDARAFFVNPGSRINLVISHSGERSYTFEALSIGEKGVEKSSSSVKVTVPPPTEDAKHVAEDIETFDQLLAQYADLEWSYATPEKSPVPPPLPTRNLQVLPSNPSRDVPHTNIKASVEEHRPVDDTSLRGRLVLVDEGNGDVVGELPQTLRITEDPSLPTLGKTDGGTGEAAPVVLELDPDVFDACTGARPLGTEGEALLELREVFVHAVPPEEHDWMMKGATLISQAISGSTSLLLSGITSASNYYISHSTPGTASRSPTPGPSSGSNTPNVPLSPSSNSALARAHAMSGQARVISSKTSDMFGNMIRRAMGGKSEPSSSTTPSFFANSTSGSGSPFPQGPPPPYAVYTPKHRPQLPPRAFSEKTSSSSDDKTAESQGPEERKPLRTIDRVLMSANLVLTTVDDSARRMFEVGSDRIGAVVGHKYGADAQQSTHLTMHTARNVVLVYVDMRGFARRALLSRAGKEFVKARVSNRDKSRDARTPSPLPGPPPSEKV